MVEQSEPAEGVVWHLLRCIGAQLITLGFLALALARAPNRDAHSALYYALTLTFAIKLAAVLHAKANFPDDFQPDVGPAPSTVSGPSAGGLCRR